MMARLFGGTVPAAYRGGVVALGNFDGFHRGHQAVVGAALARARAEGRPALVATFDPHPARFFRPEAPPFALTTTGQKLDLLDAFGVDATMVMPFDAAFAALSAEAFVADWLAARIGAAGATSGGDFTFGRGRSGDVALLARLGAAHGIAAAVVAPVTDPLGVISSSRIRECLECGGPAGAADMLTRPFTIRGVVEHGAKLGRTLGYPTANLRLGDYQRPAYGIYAVRMLVDGAWVDGVANLGVRPMFDPPVELLEVHLLDWAGDLYGRAVDVALVALIREERKLADLAALKAQIDRDTAKARTALARAAIARPKPSG